MLVRSLVFGAIFFHASLWANEFRDVKQLAVLPLSEADVRRAYAVASADSCEQVAEDQPRELTSFALSITPGDSQARVKPSTASTRRGFLSVGIDVDEKNLPTLSKSKIVEYVDRNYLVLQTRIRRDLLDRQLYYHHRPIAITCQFTGAGLTQRFEPVVAQTTSGIRSLGVLVDPDIRPLKAEHLRTIVLGFRFERVDLSGRTQENYELAIIRGRQEKSPPELVPHVFVTLNNRTQLVYLNEFQYPRVKERCGIVSRVKITQFDSTTGLYPQRSVTERYTVGRRAEFDMEKLQEYCKQNLGGSLDTSVSKLLDEIIDGKLDSGSMLR